MPEITGTKMDGKTAFTVDRQVKIEAAFSITSSRVKKTSIAAFSSKVFWIRVRGTIYARASQRFVTLEFCIDPTIALTMDKR